MIFMKKVSLWVNENFRGRSRSEVELVDVVLVKDERFSEEDVVALDFELTERTGFELRVARLQGSLHQRDGRFDGEGAEILGLPEDDAVGDPFLHVAAVLAREAE